MPSFRALPTWHVFAYNRANTRTSVLKNLTLPNYEFGKGQYAFFPMKFSRFGERNKVCQKYQKFIRRDSHKLGETPLDLQENSKVKHHFWGFKASKVHESSWIWSVIYWMKMTFFVSNQFQITHNHNPGWKVHWKNHKELTIRWGGGGQSLRSAWPKKDRFFTTSFMKCFKKSICYQDLHN